MRRWLLRIGFALLPGTFPSEEIDNLVVQTMDDRDGSLIPEAIQSRAGELEPLS